MRNYNKKVARVHEHIADLKVIIEQMRLIEEMVCNIEKDLAEIDGQLPPDEKIDAMPEGREKERIQHLCDLLKDAYEMIDEVLGTPEEEKAQGEQERFTIDDILNFLPRNKRHDLS